MTPDELFHWMRNPSPAEILKILDPVFVNDLTKTVLQSMGLPCRMCGTPTKKSFMFCSEACFHAQLNQDEATTGKRPEGMRESILSSWSSLNQSILRELSKN